MRINLTRLWGVKRKVCINNKTYEVPYVIKFVFLGIPLERWIAKEGKESAANRLKALKLWAIQILAGRKDFTIPWIKSCTYRGYKIPNFPLFKHLVNSVYSSNLKAIRHILAILNSYKLYRPSLGQLESIVNVPQVKLDPEYIRKLLLYVDLPRIPESALAMTQSVLKNSAHALDFGRTLVGPMGIPSFSEEEGSPYADHDWYGDGDEAPPIFIDKFANCVGRLVPVPDKGKARTILIGHWHLQLRTKRLADWLREFLWSLPEIASGRQQKMVDFIKFNSQSHFMMSLDQSEATDRLSRHFQIAILEHMGVSSTFFNFLDLPFYYDPKLFKNGDKIGSPSYGTELRSGKYSNGQGMGLYISFPMFELAHYVIAKFAVASTSSLFSICGDDIVFACPSEAAAREVENRYTDVIESLGGKINHLKTIMHPLIEGVGKLLLVKGKDLIDLTPPSGNISQTESRLNTVLHSTIEHRSAIGRAILFSWQEPVEIKEYTYKARRKFWKWLLSSDYHLNDVSYNNLFKDRDNRPQTWSWDQEDPRVGRELLDSRSTVPILKFVTESRLKDALITTRIKSYFKKGPDSEE